MTQEAIKQLIERVERVFVVPHIYKDGARYHVHSYHGYRSGVPPFETVGIVWCSESRCEDNAAAIKECIEHKIELPAHIRSLANGGRDG